MAESDQLRRLQECEAVQAMFPPDACEVDVVALGSLTAGDDVAVPIKIHLQSDTSDHAIESDLCMPVGYPTKAACSLNLSSETISRDVVARIQVELCEIAESHLCEGAEAVFDIITALQERLEALPGIEEAAHGQAVAGAVLERPAAKAERGAAKAQAQGYAEAEMPVAAMAAAAVQRERTEDELEFLFETSQPNTTPKFPSTHHLFDASRWYRRNDGKNALEGDKVETDKAIRAAFLGGCEVISEEKIDGQNLSICFPPDAVACAGHNLCKPAFQHRGGSVGATSSKRYSISMTEGTGLDAWFYERHKILWQLLGHRYVLYGEWCLTVHTVKYDKLPDKFTAFDIFDLRIGKYLSTRKRDQWLLPLGIRVVRRVDRPPYSPPRTEKQYRELLYGPDGNKFALPDGTEQSRDPLLSGFMSNPLPVEGIYLRVEEGGFLKYRLKIVRHDFIQAVDQLGRHDKKPVVLQEYDTQNWTYCFATLCNCNVQNVMVPREIRCQLEPDYDPEVDA